MWRWTITPVAIGVLHVVLGVATVWLVMVLGRWGGLGSRAAALAALLVACDPILVMWSTQIMTETLAVFLAVAGLVALSSRHTPCAIRTPAKTADGTRSVPATLAALAGATIDLGVYRCAASIAGVSDLERMLQVERQTGGRQAEKYWKSFMGVAVWTDPKLDLISPIKHVAQVEAPVLLIHGKDDSVVLYDQSVRMADALRKAGKSVELVTLDGEDHWLSSSKTRLLMLTSLVAFLEKHNPPDAPLKAARSQ